MKPGWPHKLFSTCSPYTGDRASLLEEISEAAEVRDAVVAETDGEAPGLDREHVLAISQDDQEAVFVWVEGGFRVTLAVPAEVADAEAGFRTLPVLVDAVAASLDGS